MVTVMIVENNMLAAMAIKIKFKMYLNVEVVIVQDGEDAVEHFKNKNHNIRLILMDTELGVGINGTEAAKIMRDFESEVGNKRCFIYAVTNHTEESDIKYQASMGIDRTFKKPFTDEAFQQVIDNIPELAALKKAKPSLS